MFISIEARDENVKSMTFYECAFRYIWRKRSQSILLLVCFFIISVIILSATVILQSAQATNLSIQEKTGTKLVLHSETGITADIIAQIQGISSVSKINRTVSNTAFPVGFSPVIKKDGTDMAVSLHAYDNTGIDGLFAEEKYRLLDGIHITENQIFVDHKLFWQLYGAGKSTAVSVYTADPEKLSELQMQIESLVEIGRAHV